MDKPTEKFDLTFCSSDELVKELNKRHDALIISGVKFTNINGEYKVIRNYFGHRLVCLGLLSNMSSLINIEENKSLILDNYA
jgi:hypothetical protein